MRIRNLFISALVLLAMGAGTVLAVPVELYLVKFIPGTDVYRLAGSQKWPVYHISGQQALMGLPLSGSGHQEVQGSSLAYRGLSEDLRWVHLKRNNQPPVIKAVYSGKDMLLAETGSLTAAGIKSGSSYVVRPFRVQPIIIPTSAVVRNNSLTLDTAVAALAGLIDTAHVRATIDTFQAFNTRSIMASNHDSVAKWIQTKFLGMGIADVKIDSFTDAGLNADMDSVIWMKNVVATIPGTKDTSTVYVIGGHYDSSVWPYNPWAPGADDNASGTTAAMEAAEVLAANPPATTIKFVAFDGEEWGLYGCEYFAEQALSQGMNIATMLNFDMIGNLGNQSLFNCYSYDGSEIYAGLSGQCAQWYGRTADTNLVPFYVNDNSSGSDSWSFFARGYPVAYSEEYLFSPNWHLISDSTTYMNMRYCTSIIRAGMGLLGTLANYPQKVRGLAVKDVGNGTQLYVNWQPNQASNVTGYKLYWGKASGSYIDSMPVAGTSDTIGGLNSDSLYYIGVIAMDDENRESPLISEITGTPKSLPLAPSGLAAVPVDSGIRLNWKSNLELDMEGYNVYRRIDNGTFDSLTHTADTFLLEKPLSGASRYYYKIQAQDAGGNTSLLSDSVYSRPITRDQGILLVDETNNWISGSFPRDAQQDSFYNYILNGYKYEPYEYGISLQKPILADLGPYSTVAWFSDDYVTLLASGAVNDMKSYLDAGGKLWLAGWKPCSDVQNSTTYPFTFVPGSILYDYFGLANAELSAATDSFIVARGSRGYPDIAIDTLKYPLTIWGRVLRYVEALTPAGAGDTIYTVDLKNDSSPFEGRACAVRDSGKTVFFGFPLYFMDREQVKAAAQQVMLEFGEEPLGVAGKPENLERITDFRLFQNSPNPFKNQTSISYQLPKSGMVKLNIYNIAGQLVKTLVSGEQAAGSYAVKWDRLDSKNRQVSAGVYIYHLSTDGKTQSRKMIVLK
ncbi:M28 family peptidase [candidate division TA06 bacterium]|nr:M28 family peptidase [candidate division TA06 bacterium]